MILVINESRKLASAVSDMLYFMGIPSYAATPKDAEYESPELYRAMVIINPCELSNEEESLILLGALFDRVPIFAYGKSAYTTLYNAVFNGELSIPELISNISCYFSERALPSPFSYTISIGGLNIDLSGETRTNDSFTKSEKMILRLFGIAGSCPVTAEEILKYAFRSSRLPEISSIRTHISIINKKCIKIYGRKIISLRSEGAYAIIENDLQSTFQYSET